MSALQSKRNAIVGSCVLAAVLAAGAVLRFYDIGRKSLWLDEAATMVLGSDLNFQFFVLTSGGLARYWGQTSIFNSLS